MLNWRELRVLCLGGAGQVGREACRQLAAEGAGTIFVHDLALARSEEAAEELRAAAPGTRYVASGGNLFHPAGLGTWEFGGSPDRICREVEGAAEDAEHLFALLDARLGPLTPEVVRSSLLWNLADAYRPHVIVDAINTATVLGYRGDLIQSARAVAAGGRRLVEALGPGAGSLRLEDLEERLAALPPDRAREATRDLAGVLRASLHMTAFLDTASLIRFVQCLHALFQGEGGTAVPGFCRYVKVHTTGLGGMGFNIRYTHGDTGEPGLSTKLLGKVCATGSLTQLLLTLSHTPGCDVRVVVPATLIGWVEPKDLVIRGVPQRWEGPAAPAIPGPLPIVDTRELVPCDGSRSLRDAMCEGSRHVVDTGEKLEVPHLASGENQPYAAEDIAAVTSLGQMGCITKEEVARAALECVAGDSRYDVLTAIDAALLLPTQTAAAARDRELAFCRAQRRRGGGFRTPSISLGNLGPTTAKHLFEVEIVRATWGTVEQVAKEASEGEMTLRACSYLLDDGEGALLRRQVLSLGIPVFLRRGPGEAGLLVGGRLLFPDPKDEAALGCRLDPVDPSFQSCLAKGWIDVTGPRMRWWRDRFAEVHDALRAAKTVSRNWFDPAGAFTAGQFLAYHYSISGGARKDYM